MLRRAAATLGLALDRARTLEAFQESEMAVRQQNSQLEERLRALRAANADLGAFAMSLSHDLRTPDRHMILFLGLLRRALGETLSVNPKAVRYLEVIEEATRRA